MSFETLERHSIESVSIKFFNVFPYASEIVVHSLDLPTHSLYVVRIISSSNCPVKVDLYIESSSFKVQEEWLTKWFVRKILLGMGVIDLPAYLCGNAKLCYIAWLVPRALGDRTYIFLPRGTAKHNPQRAWTSLLLRLGNQTFFLFCKLIIFYYVHFKAFHAIRYFWKI